MAQEIAYRLLSILRSVFYRITNCLSKRIAEKQKENVDIELNRNKVWYYPNQDEEHFPRMSYISIICKNNSDIEFEINEISIRIAASSSSTPDREGKNTYPVLSTTESERVLTEEKIGKINTNSTELGRRGEPNSSQIIKVEFEIPHWLDDINRFYIVGKIQFQRDIEKKFSIKINGKNIEEN